MNQDDDKTIVASDFWKSSGRGPIIAHGNSDVLPVGTKLEEFEIRGVIGKGGFGIVYRAYDGQLDCDVALKEYMPSGLAYRARPPFITVRSHADADLFNIGLQSFIKEARMLRRFNSPSLVKVHRFFEANGTAYMAMPFYEGVTLKQAVNKEVIVPSEQWIKNFLANLLSAVENIHRVQCYHRDIAPDNILLLFENGCPVLLDFGAARRVISDHTQVQTAILKPGFAPIEQYADMPGTKQGPWTDVYAVGAVVYYLITGKAPEEAVARVMKDHMLPASEAGKGRFSPSFLDATDRALAVRPEDRIQNISELRKAYNIKDDIARTVGPLPQEPQPSDTERKEPYLVSDVKDSVLRRSQSKLKPESLSDHPLEINEGTVPATSRRPDRPAMGWRVQKLGLALVVVLVAGVVAIGVYRNFTGLEKTLPKPKSTSLVMQPEGSVRESESKPEIVGTEPQEVPTTPQSGKPQNDILAEELSWASAKTLNTTQSFETYVREYPNGRYLASAKAALEKLQSVRQPVSNQLPSTPSSPITPDLAKEESVWQMAQALDEVPAYESYLNQFARGKYTARARARLKELNALKAGEANPPQKEYAIPDQPRSGSSSGGGQVASSASKSQPSVNPDLSKPERNQESKEPNVTAEERSKEPEPMTTASPRPRTGIEKRIVLKDQSLFGDFVVDPATGSISGTGRVEWDNGDRFEGTLAKGLRVGKGTFIWANGQNYRGDWASNLPNGKGTMTFTNGNRYEGDMKDGQPNGSGSIHFSKGDRYQGEVKNGLPHGKGTNRFSSGDRYIGEWSMGKSNGHGRYVWASGAYWEGEFRDDKRTENGRMVTAAEAAAGSVTNTADGGKNNASLETRDRPYPEAKHNWGP